MVTHKMESFKVRGKNVGSRTLRSPTTTVHAIDQLLRHQTVGPRSRGPRKLPLHASMV